MTREFVSWSLALCEKRESAEMVVNDWRYRGVHVLLPLHVVVRCSHARSPRAIDIPDAMPRQGGFRVDHRARGRSWKWDAVLGQNVEVPQLLCIPSMHGRT